MIFRRVKAHIEKENWFAVAIDFAIVVIGVFIGIQVANWNEGRAEQARGENIKARLVAEFIEIESELVRHVRDITQWIEIAEHLSDDILADRVVRDQKAFSDRLYSINWRPNSGGSNTINELISQGDMDILDSPELVEALLRFDTLAERHTANNLTLRRAISDDRNVLSKISYLAAIPTTGRPEDFSQKLAQLNEAPDIYLSVMNVSNALQTDLLWHKESLRLACTILQELNEPCRASAAITQDTTP